MKGFWGFIMVFFCFLVECFRVFGAFDSFFCCFFPHEPYGADKSKKIFQMCVL